MDDPVQKIAANMAWKPPKVGAHVEVIGAGLPRTGTASFAAAVSYLLDGPTYHCGVQYADTNDETAIKTWIEVARLQVAYPSAEEKIIVKALAAVELEGYVATADVPLSMMVEYLMELYPDAIVICTTRDKAKWISSMKSAVQSANLDRMHAMYYLLPAKRYMSTLYGLLDAVFKRTVGKQLDDEGFLATWYEKHHEMLERVVAPEKMVYFSVEDGWAPLCRALELPIPCGVPFPRINDAEALASHCRRWTCQGCGRWLLLLSSCLGTGAMVLYFCRGVSRYWHRLNAKV